MDGKPFRKLFIFIFILYMGKFKILRSKKVQRNDHKDSEKLLDNKCAKNVMLLLTKQLLTGTINITLSYKYTLQIRKATSLDRKKYSKELFSKIRTDEMNARTNSKHLSERETENERTNSRCRVERRDRWQARQT